MKANKFKIVGLCLCLLFLGVGSIYSHWETDGEKGYLAQPLLINYPAYQQQYPFLALEQNQVLYPQDSNCLNPFYGKLEQLLFEGKGQINILHMGGSHVQAGAIGHKLRNLFNGLSYGITDQRGLLYPFRAAGTNSTIYTSSAGFDEWEGQRCANNKHRADWGMMGMNISTLRDSAKLQMWSFNEDSVLHTGKKVRLYHSKDSSAFTPFWTGSAEVSQRKSDPDSPYTEWTFETNPDTLEWQFIALDSNQTQANVRGVYQFDGKPGIVYNEIGVNGASTKSYLRCEQMETELSTIPPDLVIFGIGINDAYMTSSRFQPTEFAARYDSLISMMKRVNPEVSILLLTNNDSYYRKRYANPNGSKVRQVMLDLSEKHGVAVWDLFEIMGGLSSVRQWEKAGLAKRDKIHFTRKGYYLQAELMYSALMEDFGERLSHSEDLGWYHSKNTQE